ncbi:MAG TPA: NUDIX domain-containing protein [Bacillota bacterium]|nr:NUDIX domain-containing protein [Bacillota bacterium]
MNTLVEMVDILVPPYFTKSGRHKTQEQAWRDQDWIGTFNLWVVQNSSVPALVYQVRSPESSWAPNKLDATAGGHYQAGEERADGLREVVEELGKHYQPSQLTFVGRKLHVAPDVHGFERRNIVDISFIIDNAPLSSYTLQPEEVYAICACPLSDLVKAHSDPAYAFTTEALKSNGEHLTLTVSKDSFPDNWDDYHFKIALLAERFVAGDQHLIY